MTPSQYRQRYLDFQTALGQTRIVAFGAVIALDDFPMNLPGSFPRDLQNALSHFGKTVLEAVETARARGESLTVDLSLDTLPAEHRSIGESIVHMLMSYWLGRSEAGDQNPPKPDFRSIIYAQELVMHLAHLDGFLADSLRAMCVARPELLCREKKISWEEVVQAGSYESLLGLLVEEYVYEFGWQSARERVGKLESVHGLVIPTASSVLDAIDEAEQVRHLVVHNASRVSREYIRRAGKSDVQIGTPVSIQASLVAKVAASVQELAEDVFVAVAAKYFGKPHEEAAGL